MTQITVVKNDKLYDLNFTLKNADGTAFNLTGYSLLFKVKKEGADAIKFSTAMAIVSAAAGTCKYTVQDTNFNDTGIFNAEIQLTKSSEIITFTEIRITVVEEIV